MHRHRSVHTTHLCLLTLQSRAVVLRSNHPFTINDGDQLIVSGRFKRGVLQGLAHHNLSNGSHSHAGIWLPLIMGPLLVAIAVFLWNAMNGASINDIPIQWIIPGAFMAIGVYSVVQGLRVKQAVHLVQNAIR